MLAAKRLRAAARAWPALDLEGARREWFLAWALAPPLAESDCPCEDGQRFQRHLESMRTASDQRGERDEGTRFNK